LTTSLVSARRGSARIERAPSALGPTSGRLLGRIGHGPDLEPLAGQGIGILRYRLWDIDRLVNRTLVYGLLTASLGAIYVGLVLVLGQLFGGVGSETPSWAVASATLAVAALFQPARRRIQQAVDRRFNRRRYDAARTVEAFSLRLRDQVELDTISPSCSRLSTRRCSLRRPHSGSRHPARQCAGDKGERSS
jgi:hypothetical protein